MIQGTIHHREAFLNRIADRLGRDRHKTVRKPEWQYKPQWEVYKDLSQDDLLSVFKKACTKVHTEVSETIARELDTALISMIERFGGGPIVIGKDQRFHDYGLDQTLEKQHVFTWNLLAGKENIDQSAQANIGISFSDMTLAESGTVVFFNNKEKARSVSLLPTTSIVIIPKSSIVPRITQATKVINERVKAGEKIESYINMVSGPSNSADIEMNLVVGVHGPVKVGYLVVADR